MAVLARLRQGLLLGLILAVAGLAAPAAVAAGPQPRPPTPSPTRYGSWVAFHGWSFTSRFVAYTRTRHRPPAKRGGEPRDDVQRLHREVRRGAFRGHGSESGGDVEGFARDNGYVATRLPSRKVGEGRVVFGTGADEVVLELVTGRRLGWRLSRGGKTLATHTFRDIYVDVEADLYPSPDGRQAILVMHLDKGWVVDAAVYPVWLGAPPRKPEPDSQK